jgi:hypothetical protein
VDFQRTLFNQTQSEDASLGVQKLGDPEHSSQQKAVAGSDNVEDPANTALG